MSLLRKLFGVRSLDEERAEAERLFAAKDYGHAKLAFERALDKAKDAPDAVRAELSAKIAASRDGVATQLLATAEAYASRGEIDLARTELESAIEAAADPEVKERAMRRLETLERTDAVAQAAPDVEVSDEDRLAVLAGSWEEPQAAEYDSYGEAFTNALLAMHDGRASEARPVLEALLEGTEEPRYLWLEIARVRFATEDPDAAAQALVEFLSELTEGEGGDARLAAHVELARLADERGDFDGAVAQLEKAVGELDEDHRPYLALGRFLRTKGHAEEAIEVLEAAMNVMDDMRPDWQVIQELGLAQADAGRDDEAIETLERVVSLMMTLRVDLPATTGVPLAKLYEKKERLDRAADLYGTLARGRDRANHALYHEEAGRLLAELGLVDEARRMLQRASALSEGDAEAHARVEARLAELSGPDA